MLIHGSTGTGASATPLRFARQLNVPPDPLGSTSPCYAHAIDGLQPVWAMRRAGPIGLLCRGTGHIGFTGDVPFFLALWLAECNVTNRPNACAKA